jgi:hypothetical protein
MHRLTFFSVAAFAAAAAGVVTAQPASSWTPCAGLNPSNGPYSAWNATACPPGWSCSPNGFSHSGMGCAPFPNAVSCPSGYMACPQGTQCVLVSGSGYGTVYSCQAGGSPVTVAKCPCKGGIPLPLSTTKKNVLVIGDSLSIGYTPYVNANLEDVALVQHAPWDFTDGGAEETAYGVQCLDFYFVSPSGMPLTGIDVITFNWGMHNLQPACQEGYGCVPGQSGNASVYPAELANITARLQAFSQSVGAKLLYINTSPMLCNTTIDGVIAGTLNPAAQSIMQAAGIPLYDMHTAMRNQTGPPPQSSCWGENGGCCPHPPAAGYTWMASVLGPVIRAML